MKKMLLILLITVLAFAGTVIWFNYNDRQIQDSLINMFLGMCAAELVAMGGIKAFKVKYQIRKDGESDV
jgi:Na+/H+ antiporter NhaC